MGEFTKLEAVTSEEWALLRAYRICDHEHRSNVVQFALASSMRRTAPLGPNVVRIVDHQNKSR